MPPSCQVRTSTRELPSSHHTYGALVTKDIEGAGAGEIRHHDYNDQKYNIRAAPMYPNPNPDPKEDIRTPQQISQWLRQVGFLL